VKNPRLKMYSFRLYIDEMDQLKTLARKERTTVTELVRKWVRKWVRKGIAGAK
jgi:hypothetical protein